MTAEDYVQLKAKQQINLSGSSLPLYPQYNFQRYETQQYIDKYYLACAVISGCILTWQFAMVEPEKQIIKGGKPVDNQDLRSRLFACRYTGLSESDIENLKITYILLGGNAYALKLRGRGGQVEGIHPYSDRNIVPIPSKDKWISHYELYTFENEKIAEYAPEDIIHFPWVARDPNKPYMGKSPIAFIQEEAQTDELFTQHLATHIKNNAVPNFIVQAPNYEPQGLKMLIAAGLSEKSAQVMMQSMQRDFSGDGAGKSIFLPPPFEGVSIGSTLKDMDLTNARAVPEVRMCSPFRVPPELAIINSGLSHSTENNQYAADVRFTKTVVSYLSLDADKYTGAFREELGESKVLYNIDKLAGVQEQKRKDKAAVQTEVREFVKDYYGKKIPDRVAAVNLMLRLYPEIVSDRSDAEAILSEVDFTQPEPPKPDKLGNLDLEKIGVSVNGNGKHN